MKRRLDLSEAVVVPWEIPDIDAARKVTGFLETALAPPAAAATPKPNGNGAGEVPPPPAPIAAAEPRAAMGHAEGFDLGLRDGRERGYADGLAEGRAAAAREFTEQAGRLEALVRRLGEPIRAVERPVEEAVIALALEVARWVIGGEISVSREHLSRLIREAVAKVPIDVGIPVIVLNPADADMIRELAPDLEASGVALIADDSVEAGGCRIIANGAEGIANKDRRWHPRALQGICEVDLTLASRWRDAMFAMFEGEDT